MSGRALRAGGLDPDSALTQRVRAVAMRLVGEVGAFRSDATRWPWRFDVIDTDALDAFSTPSGRIGISTGLVRRLALSDAELATVLGHEIAHVLREHVREQASQEEISSAVVHAIAVFGGRGAALQSAVADAGSHYLVALPFSRHMESEADLIGLELMARAGYDPRLAGGVWQKLMALAPGGRPAGLLSTHPGDAQRIADLEAAVPKVMALYEARADAQALSPSTRDDAAASGTRPPVAAAAVVIGPDSWQVERMARSAACHPQPVAALVDRGPGFGIYSVGCSNGEAATFRCEFGTCRAVR